ncbi:hypothetical protein ACFSUP_04300 [Gracilibacillus thailandensis]|uniref:hypothetical protein n=1 Tax=Gracilibacillus thailandensis TaxID=563735 RepID=UPI00363057DF
MSDQSDGEIDHNCPECDAELDAHPSGTARLFWCENCDKEFWQEGTESPSWFACGTDGVIHGV